MSEPPPDSRKCAVCGKPQDPAFRPFCSKRCADIDLGRWLKEGYSIPGGEPPPDEGSVDEAERNKPYLPKASGFSRP